MKPIKLLLLSAIVLTMMLNACKKDETKTYPITGTWVGKYGNGTSTPDFFFSFKVNESSLIVYANNETTPDTATGTWTLTGTTFTETHTYNGGGATFSSSATFDNTGKLTGGSWGSGTSTSGGGLYYMDRVN